jgi:hypothetical protein
VIGEHLAGAGDMAHQAVEDAAPLPVVVHAELEEMTQKTPALRDAKGERVADGWRCPRTARPRRSAGSARRYGLLDAIVRASDAGLTQVAQAALTSRRGIGKPAAGSTASAAARRMPGRPACSPASG